MKPTCETAGYSWNAQGFRPYSHLMPMREWLLKRAMLWGLALGVTLGCGADQSKAKSPEQECAAGALHVCEHLCRTQASLDACVPAGVAYIEGDGLGPDLGIAVELLEAACMTENQVACGHVGQLVVDGKLPDLDPVEASLKLRKACFGHHSASCAKLGMMTKYGDGISKNEQRGTELLRNACSSGEAPACYEVAENYLYGKFVTAEPERGVRYLKAGCAAEVAAACYRLGLLHMNGEFVEQDDNRAFELFRVGCERRDRNACGTLGIF